MPYELNLTGSIEETGPNIEIDGVDEELF